jgi:hypothetical protein
MGADAGAFPENPAGRVKGISTTIIPVVRFAFLRDKTARC